MTESTPPPAPASQVRAFVHTPGARTRYVRSGRGAPAILLTESAWTGPLLRRLGEGLCVFVPEVPAARTAATDPLGRLAFCRWLCSFFDGLGVERASLVAGSGHAAAALAFALLEEDRVERLVLVDAPDPLDAPDAELAARTTRPLLCLHAPAVTAAAVESAALFLLHGD